MENNNITKGRGAQFNPQNTFLKNEYTKEFAEGIDDWEEINTKTQFIIGSAKTIVNKVESPDVHMFYSANPYQGCEHGCVYCYARNTHEYWGYSAGIDFESRIIVKKNAPILFKKFLEKKNWQAQTISISGNTDCYQPAERKFKLTRQILEIALAYKQPIGMITKNSLIMRDIDILSEMAKLNLICVYVSINSLNEELRSKLEPRTTTAKQRLKIIETLAINNIPVGVMEAPIIPGLNDTEIPQILKTVALNGAKNAGYTIVRLNGQIGNIFEDWLNKSYPEKVEKVWHSIQSCHHGKVNDSNYKTRMSGTGVFAKLIKETFELHCKLNGLNKERIMLDSSSFNTPGPKQLSLF